MLRDAVAVVDVVPVRVPVALGGLVAVVLRLAVAEALRVSVAVPEAVGCQVAVSVAVRAVGVNVLLVDTESVAEAVWDPLRVSLQDGLPMAVAVSVFVTLGDMLWDRVAEGDGFVAVTVGVPAASASIGKKIKAMATLSRRNVPAGLLSSARSSRLQVFFIASEMFLERCCIAEPLLHRNTNEMIVPHTQPNFIFTTPAKTCFCSFSWGTNF